MSPQNPQPTDNRNAPVPASATIYETDERLDAAADKLLAEDLQAAPTMQERIAQATQGITEQFQDHNGCKELEPYSRQSTIECDDTDGIRSEIELVEHYKKTMTEPHHRVTASVTVKWPCDESDSYALPVFVEFFKVTAPLSGKPQYLEDAIFRARRWRDSTIKAMTDARDQHALDLGIDLDGEVTS